MGSHDTVRTATRRRPPTAFDATADRCRLQERHPDRCRPMRPLQDAQRRQPRRLAHRWETPTHGQARRIDEHAAPSRTATGQRSMQTARIAASPCSRRTGHFLFLIIPIITRRHTQRRTERDRAGQDGTTRPHLDNPGVTPRSIHAGKPLSTRYTGTSGYDRPSVTPVSIVIYW